MMKKTICLLLMLMMLLPAAVAEGNFTYFTMQGGGIRVTGYRGAGGNVTVPETIGGEKVVSIGEHAFEGSALTSVTLPASVRDIGTAAFRNCARLTSAVILSGGELTIGNYAFYGCGLLEEVSFDGNLRVLTAGSHAFDNCVSLKDFLLPDTLTTIRVPRNAFCGDDALSSEPWNAVPVSREMTAELSAFTRSNNHIGFSWTQEYFINGEKVNNYCRVPLKPGDTVTVSATVTEHDKKPDTGSASATHTVTEQDLMQGFKVEFQVDVAENGGRYKGYISTWNVTFRFY